jgi:2,3-bisphosphoglycerate-independent phosphoglycerate mutase
VLRDHPVNVERRSRGDIPATMIWLFWGSARIPDIPAFKEAYGLDASMVSGVDVTRGLARMVGIKILDVAGVTGDLNNDYAAQGEGTLRALELHDMAVVHVEATDEAAHAGLVREKIEAIEMVDREIVSRLRSWHTDAFRMLILPDHSTPVEIQTHVADPVPFVLWGPGFTAASRDGVTRFTEPEARRTGVAINEGHSIMGRLIG